MYPTNPIETSWGSYQKLLANNSYGSVPDEEKIKHAFHAGAHAFSCSLFGNLPSPANPNFIEILFKVILDIEAEETAFRFKFKEKTDKAHSPAITE